MHDQPVSTPRHGAPAALPPGEACEVDTLQRNVRELQERLAEAEAAAAAARREAIASAAAKTAFIANISHEIRTPLNALLGMAQLLEQSDLDRSQKSHVQVVLEAGRSLKTLLDDVITLAGGGVADMDGPLQCDGAESLRTVARLLQPKAWEKKLRLTITAPPRLPMAVADPRRLRQVLLKLADNAVKFTERGGVELRVEVTADAGFLRFSVSDTGLGLAPEATAHLFEPFSPGQNSYARAHDGAGLGLAVARKLVEGMGGQIGFASAPGEGATFWFTVPAAGTTHAAPEQALPIAGDAPPPSGLALLLACANEACALQIEGLLEPFGNRLTRANSVGDALSLSGQQRFDAIIAAADEADMLAGAPSVSVPVVALVGPGMRMPMAAHGAVRWPGPAAALYMALNDAAGRGGAAPAPGAEAPAIDAEAFAGLEKSLGLTTLIDILHAYFATADELCAKLDAAVAAGERDEASRLAQDLAGAAGGLGLAAMTGAARGIVQRLREGDAEIAPAAAAVAGEHARARKALAALYSDLAL